MRLTFWNIFSKQGVQRKSRDRCEVMNPTWSSSVSSDPPAGPSAVCAAPDFYSYTELKHYAVTFTPDTICNYVINPNTDMKQFLEAPISRYVKV